MIYAIPHTHPRFHAVVAQAPGALVRNNIRKQGDGSLVTNIHAVTPRVTIDTLSANAVAYKNFVGKIHRCSIMSCLIVSVLENCTRVASVILEIVVALIKRIRRFFPPVMIFGQLEQLVACCVFRHWGINNELFRPSIGSGRGAWTDAVRVCEFRPVNRRLLGRPCPGVGRGILGRGPSDCQRHAFRDRVA